MTSCYTDSWDEILLRVLKGCLITYRRYPLRNCSLLKISKKTCLSFAEMAYVAEELCLNALLRLEVGKCLILFIGTLIPTVSKMERLFIFRFKTLVRKKASKCHRLE
jgi:hypothetical protein